MAKHWCNKNLNLNLNFGYTFSAVSLILLEDLSQKHALNIVSVAGKGWISSRETCFF